MIYRFYFLLSLLWIGYVLPVYANLTQSLTIGGTLSATNTCSIGVGASPVSLNIGEMAFSDISSVSFQLLKPFESYASYVTCTFPTAIAIAYTSSLGPSTIIHDLGLYRTPTGTIVASLSANIDSVKPTADSVPAEYTSVGNDLSLLSSSSTYSIAPANTSISGVVGNINSAFAVIDKTTQKLLPATTFSLPFTFSLYSFPSTAWQNELAGLSYSLNATITITLHTI